MIVVKETSISQSESTIYITLQIPVKFELYASPLYISLNASPYFYEIDLGERIDPDSSKVVVEDGSVRIQLEKVVKGNWDQIKYKGTSIEVRERREMSRREEEERQAHIKKTEISRKRADERELVKRQMAVEGEMRTRVMELKKSEAEKASNSIMEYATSSGGMVGLDTTLPALNPSSSPSPSPSVPTLQSILDCSEDSDSDIDLEIIKARIRPPKHAPPRQTTTTKIKVKFSNRGLIPTTTARESEDGKSVCV